MRTILYLVIGILAVVLIESHNAKARHLKIVTLLEQNNQIDKATIDVLNDLCEHIAGDWSGEKREIIQGIVHRSKADTSRWYPVSQKYRLEFPSRRRVD